MDDSDFGPDPTDPVWMSHFATSDDTSSVGGVLMPGAPQPAFDPNEPWTELPELKKVSPGAAFDVVNELRKAGVPVLGSKPRRAGLLAGGKVNVTLSVPDRLRSQATLIVATHFPDQ